MGREENILDNSEFLAKYKEETLSFPPLDMGDQSLENIDWMPIKGTFYHAFTKSIVHRKTTTSDGELITFETTPKKNYFYVNLLIAAIWFVLFIQTKDSLQLLVAIMALTSAYQQEYNPIISYFDQGKGLYWKRSMIPTRWLIHPKERFPIRLTDVRAIQILENVANLNNSHELNMVLKNNERILITAHQDDALMMKDGEELARFIGVPLLTKKEGK